MRGDPENIWSNRSKVDLYAMSDKADCSSFILTSRIKDVDVRLGRKSESYLGLSHQESNLKMKNTTQMIKDQRNAN